MLFSFFITFDLNGKIICKFIIHFILSSIIELFIPYSFTSVINSFDVFPRMLILNGIFGPKSVKIGMLCIIPNGTLKILSFLSKYLFLNF